MMTRNSLTRTFPCLILVFCVTILDTRLAQGQLNSPCPDTFRYLNTADGGKWNAELDLSTEDELQGVWLHIDLDKKANLLINWFGDSSTTDNTHFAIRRPDFKLLPGPKLVVKLEVNYNAADSPPQVTNIRLNGRSICGIHKPIRTTEAPKPFVSKQVSAKKPPVDDLLLHPVYNFDETTETTTETRDTTTFFTSRPVFGRLNATEPVPISTQETPHRPPRTTIAPIKTQTTKSRPQKESATSQTSNATRGQVSKPASATISADSFDFGGAPNRGSSSSSSAASASATSKGHASSSASSSASSNAEDFAFGSGSDFFRPPRPTKPPVKDEGSNEYFQGDFSVALNAVKRKNGFRRPPVLERQEKCGVAVPRAVGLITHGVNAHTGAWPWHVAIFAPEGFSTIYICGGSLITKRHVITAAHCVTRPRTKTPSDAEGLLLHLGRTNLKRFGRDSQDRHVDRIIVHPQFDPSNYHNDVAILVMNEAAKYTDYVRPICRWNEHGGDNNIVDKLGTVVGWGYDDSQQVTDHLQETKMPVVELSECIFSNREVFSRVTNRATYCAGFKNGTSVCNGDSGSGMFFQRPDPDNSNEKHWELRGLVSLGLSLQSQSSLCDPYGYTVFTDLQKFSSWITNNIYEEE